MEEKDALRINARLFGDEATLLRELAGRTGDGISVVVRKALRRYHAELDRLYEGAGGPQEDAAAAAVVAPNDVMGSVSPPEPPPMAPEPPAAEPLPSPPHRRTPTGMDYGVGVHILTAPFDPAAGLFDDEAVQRFLLNKRVRRLVPAFFAQDGRAYWSVWVEYEPPTGTAPSQRPTAGRERSLDATQQRLYDRLSAWRKAKAEAAGVPVYVVATNAQLADVARLTPRSLEALRQVKGFGKSKLERYGREILALVGGFLDDGPAGNR